MKKYINKVIVGMIILSLCIISGIMASADSISVYVDDEFIQLTDANGNAVYPFIQNGTTYVPLRGVSEALDCDVIWDGNNNTILIYKEMQSDNSVFRNDSDEVKLYVDNQLTELKDANGTVVKPFIKDWTTYVPLRGVSQALGCWVRWDGQTQSVKVYKAICPPDGVPLSENKPYDWSLGYADGPKIFYESDGRRMEMDGEYYSNAIKFRDNGSDALFNLDGKFESLTATVGSYGEFEKEKAITFIVDGKIVDTHTIKANSTVEEISVDLNKGLQLKIVSEGYYVGIGDIIFW